MVSSLLHESKDAWLNPERKQSWQNTALQRLQVCYVIKVTFMKQTFTSDSATAVVYMNVTYASFTSGAYGRCFQPQWTSISLKVLGMTGSVREAPCPRRLDCYKSQGWLSTFGLTLRTAFVPWRKNLITAHYRHETNHHITNHMDEHTSCWQITAKALVVARWRALVQLNDSPSV